MTTVYTKQSKLDHYHFSIFLTFSASVAFAFLALEAPAAPKAAKTPSSTQTAALNAQIARLHAPVATPNGQAKALPTSVYGHPFVNAFDDNSPGGPHLIFAHMQMSAGDYGKHYYGTAPSVADYTKDILEAKAAGIDGFACNIGGADASYQDARNNLGRAIDEVNASNAGKSNSVGVSNFYFFDQLDFATYPQDTSKILAEINAAISHPSYYRYKGRPWFGTYAGEGGTYAQVTARFRSVIASLRAQKPSVNPYFCPFFNIRDPDGTGPRESQPVSDKQEITGLLKGLADATWLYGTGAGPPLGIDSALYQAEMYSGMLRDAGIAWMGTVTPQYIGFGHHAPGRFYCEAYGGETLDHQWNSIILAQNAHWVQLVTWNDDDEGSNFSNANFGPGSPWPYLTHSSVPGYYKSKLGLQALNLYYEQWYKTGVRPIIANDNLFVFYRVQPAAAIATADSLGAIGPFYTEDGSGVVPDAFFIATAVKATTLLTVVNGGITTKKTVPVGLFFTRVGPFIPGSVSMTLSRHGTTLASITGDPIESVFTNYDYNYTTFWGHN